MEKLEKKIIAIRKSTKLPVEIVENIIFDTLSVEELLPLVLIKKYKSLACNRLKKALNFEIIVNKYPHLIKEATINPQTLEVCAYGMKFTTTDIKDELPLKLFKNLKKVTIPAREYKNSYILDVREKVKTIVLYLDKKIKNIPLEVIISELELIYPYHNVTYSDHKFTLKNNNNFKKPVRNM